MRHRFAFVLPILLAACDPGADSTTDSEDGTRDPYPSRYQALPAQTTLLQNATVLVGDGTRLEGADVLLSTVASPPSVRTSKSRLRKRSTPPVTGLRPD